MNIVIKPFNKEYQNDVKQLILNGLAEHWGFLDTSLNPDLNNNAESYKNDIFLLAFLNDELIGTGAAKIVDNQCAEIVRMSVKKDYRRNGIGKSILKYLINELKSRSFKKIILETSKDWNEVIDFYTNFGFHVSHITNDDVYFELNIVNKEI